MIRLLITVLTALVIAGCSRVGGLTDAVDAEQQWQQRQLQLQAVDSWDMHARAVIALTGETYHVGIRWQRNAEQFKLLLEAPFGQGVIRMDALPGQGYQLRLPDGRIFVNQSPEALLDEVVGWSLPISGLAYWIRGMPHPHSSYSHRADAGGRALSIDQDRWVIEYIDYLAVSDGEQLPRRLKLARSGILLKLVIEHWQQAQRDDPPGDLFPEFN